MSDLEFFFVVLAAFYLWECAGWVSIGGMALVRWWGRWSFLAQPVGNHRGGFVLAQPFPPLGSLHVLAPLPVSLSPEGVLAYVATTTSRSGRPFQTGRFVAWNEIQSVAARRKVIRVNGARMVTTPSTTYARWLANELQTLAKLEPEQRPKAIQQFIQARFDESRIRQLTTSLADRLQPVRWLANLLLVVVFVVAPLVIWSRGLVSTWHFLLAGTFLTSGALAVLFWRAHRAFFPGAEDERFSHGLMIALFPAAAIRAGDALSRPLLETFHPLAAALGLCHPTEFKQLARRLLLDMEHPALPLPTAHDPKLAALELWSRGATLEAARALVQRGGLNHAELTCPPVPAEACCRAYCPRCHAQFIIIEATCGDCGRMPVVQF